MSVCTTEIQRLAMKMPDHLMLVYEQLQTKINEIVTTENVDDRTRIAFHTFLFTIKYVAFSLPLWYSMLTTELKSSNQKYRPTAATVSIGKLYISSSPSLEQHSTHRVSEKFSRLLCSVGNGQGSGLLNFKTG